MLAIDLDARPASRAAKPSLALRLLRFLALRKRPRPVPYDHAELERFKIELELRKANAAMVSRFKVM